MYKQSEIFDGVSVDLPEMLEAREKRSYIQQALFNKFEGMTLLSATMNIPGDIKSSTILNQVFQSVIKTVRETFEPDTVEYQKLNFYSTGPEYYAVIECEPLVLKRQLIEVEMKHPYGRLLDLDILWKKEGETHLASRRDLGLPLRQCYVCQANAKECGRARKHSIEEMQSAITDIVNKSEGKED